VTLAQPFIDWGRIVDERAEIVAKLFEHLQLTVIAVVVGFAISLPLAIYAYRHRRVYGPLTAVTGVLYTIPSIAFVGFMLPFTGLSATTIEVPLVTYTLLIFIRNIVSGLEAVPDDAREAARGMGFSDRQLLWKVELPLALPVIMAGVRLATVTTIGLVTISAVIGLGGFGRFILTGLNTFDTTLSLLGAVLSLALAVAVDAALVGVERGITPWARRRSTRGVA
jgi:osmoprotectant transport system permease protein